MLLSKHINNQETSMSEDELEFLKAYDLLIDIITEAEFHTLKHKFFRSLKVDFEYSHNNICTLIKHDQETLLVEMIFYDLSTKTIRNSFAFRFTQCNAYYEWLEYFTDLRFKEGAFCNEQYGSLRVRNEVFKEVETHMQDRDAKVGSTTYNWQ